VPCCFTVPENSDRGKKRGILLENQKSFGKSTLALLVALVGADNVDHAPAAHDLAVLADLLD
jgi:hypothetical protein